MEKTETVLSNAIATMCDFAPDGEGVDTQKYNDAISGLETIIAKLRSDDLLMIDSSLLAKELIEGSDSESVQKYLDDDDLGALDWTDSLMDLLEEKFNVETAVNKRAKEVAKQMVSAT